MKTLFAIGVTMCLAAFVWVGFLTNGNSDAMLAMILACWGVSVYTNALHSILDKKYKS